MPEMTFTGERFLAELDEPDIAYEHWHRYLYATQFVSGKLVLDIAAGEGYGSALLAQHATKVVGVDVAPDAVAAAAARYSAPNLEFKQGSAARIPFEEGAFDVVVSFETIEHVDAETQRALVAEVRRVLKPGGLFLVSTPNKLTYSDLPKYSNPFHVHELYPKEFRALLEGTFPHVAVLSQRNYCGSYLWHAGRAEGVMKEYRLQHDVSGFRPSDRPKPDRYLVAACSAEPLPELAASLMVDLDDRLYRVREQRTGGLERILQEKDQALRELQAHAAMLEKTILDLDVALRGRPDYPGGAGTPAPVRAQPTPIPARAPLVTIVIPVWNKVDYTRGCLEALIRNTPGELFEIVIVDNASTDGTPEFLALLDGDVQVIRNPENVGFVGACNQGAAVARGKYLLFLNNDTAPQESWLTALLETAERDPSVGAVGARLIYPDGKLQEAGGIIFSDGSGWNFGRGDNPFLPQYERACEVDYCSGAALLVRRDLFEQLGRFDVRFAPAYYEDTDLCFGIRSLGHKVVYCPRSIVVHHEGVTAGTDLASGMKKYQVENRAKFVEKWRDALRQQDPPPQAGSGPMTADRAMRCRTPIEPAGDGPRILVVDPFMPLHDQASGSQRLFRLLQLMRALGCRVTYIGRNGNLQERYRRELESMGIEAYAGDPDRMQELGYEVHAPRVDLPALLARRRFDVAWLSFWYIGEQYLPAIRLHSSATRIVLDTVDVHFLRERRQAELEGRLGKVREELKEKERRELAVYGQADTVVTVTAADAEALRARGLRTSLTVVPNIHLRVDSSSPPFEARHGLLFVGNFAHTPNVDAIRWFCSEILPRVRERLPGARLFVVGGSPPEEIRALASQDIVVTGHVPTVEPYLDSCRVSIAPLRYGAGMKGKIGEALGRGVPVVTTRVGAEGMDLQDDEQVLVADDAASMAEAIVGLYQDRARWERLSAAGKAHIDSRYGPEAVALGLGALLAPAPALRATGSEP